MIAAVVPAAGRGSRMGRPKLALPDRRPADAGASHRGACETAGPNPVVVVTGPHDPTLARWLDRPGLRCARLTAATPDMRATVEHGLRWLEEHYHPRPDDAFLLTPGDLPMSGCRDGADVV